MRNLVLMDQIDVNAPYFLKSHAEKIQFQIAERAGLGILYAITHAI